MGPADRSMMADANVWQSAGVRLHITVCAATVADPAGGVDVSPGKEPQHGCCADRRSEPGASGGPRHPAELSLQGGGRRRRLLGADAGAGLPEPGWSAAIVRRWERAGGSPASNP